jgi:hypothetical protein
MTQARRQRSYGNRPDRCLLVPHLTPAQLRRYRHKARHAYARRDPQPRRAPRHDLAGLVAMWDEQQRKPKVPSSDQLDRLDAIQEQPVRQRKFNISWGTRRRGAWASRNG